MQCLIHYLYAFTDSPTNDVRADSHFNDRYLKTYKCFLNTSTGVKK